MTAIPAGGQADGLQRELDHLAAGLGRSVSLDDPEGALLGYSAQGSDIDPVRITAILTRQVPAAVQDYQRHHGIETATSPFTLPGNTELNMAPRLCLPILRGANRLGYLWILTDGVDLDPTDRTTANQSARRIGRILESRASQPADGPTTDRAFAELLAQTASPGDFISHLARSAPYAVDAPMQIAVAVAATLDHDERTASSAAPPTGRAPTASALHRTPGVVATHVTANRIVALLTAAGRAGAAPNALIQTLSTWESDDRCFIVATSPPIKLADATFARDYARATLACEIACFDRALPTSLSWNDLGIYQLLLAAARPGAWDSARAPLDHQMAAVTPLSQTLERYLDLGADAARTAIDLHIHRTTLYYRLRRAAQLLDVDLDNGIIRAQVHATMKAGRLARACDHFQWTHTLLDSVRP
ncbi:PucR family transcriptional regulator [Dactylosporangium sucinum]|uniref:PucR C-terminal helix-turn-helix domain-containing protein n=1 Tax=Dactylosporangium sucinum TaxID=1424081 RepID=A0A917TTE4_9ACTN|nr:helix-turn-helix domain-containing protein [Dactylosporangium sucinum]GGM36714.1 hypothetical protein GCM10007977_042760 [Dactylosporangium sucinum]